MTHKFKENKKEIKKTGKNRINADTRIENAKYRGEERTGERKVVRGKFRINRRTGGKNTKNLTINKGGKEDRQYHEISTSNARKGERGGYAIETVESRVVDVNPRAIDRSG